VPNAVLLNNISTSGKGIWYRFYSSQFGENDESGVFQYKHHDGDAFTGASARVDCYKELHTMDWQHWEEGEPEVWNPQGRLEVHAGGIFDVGAK